MPAAQLPNLALIPASQTLRNDMPTAVPKDSAALAAALASAAEQAATVTAAAPAGGGFVGAAALDVLHTALGLRQADLRRFACESLLLLDGLQHTLVSERMAGPNPQALARAAFMRAELPARARMVRVGAYLCPHCLLVTVCRRRCSKSAPRRLHCRPCAGLRLLNMRPAGGGAAVRRCNALRRRHRLEHAALEVPSGARRAVCGGAAAAAPRHPDRLRQGEEILPRGSFRRLLLKFPRRTPAARQSVLWLCL